MSNTYRIVLASIVSLLIGAIFAWAMLGGLDIMEDIAFERTFGIFILATTALWVAWISIIDGGGKSADTRQQK